MKKLFLATLFIVCLAPALAIEGDCYPIPFESLPVAIQQVVGQAPIYMCEPTPPGLSRAQARVPVNSAIYKPEELTPIFSGREDGAARFNFPPNQAIHIRAFYNSSRVVEGCTAEVGLPCTNWVELPGNNTGWYADGDHLRTSFSGLFVESTWKGRTLVTTLRYQGENVTGRSVEWRVGSQSNTETNHSEPTNQVGCQADDDCGKPIVCANGQTYRDKACVEGTCHTINYFAPPCGEQCQTDEDCGPILTCPDGQKYRNKFCVQGTCEEVAYTGGTPCFDENCGLRCVKCEGGVDTGLRNNCGCSIYDCPITPTE